MKKFMKKQNVVDTAVNLALGGGANVAIDYVVSSIDALSDIDERYINAGKLVIGAVGSSMVSNKMAKSALDGIAIVGASNLIKSLMGGETSVDGGATGVPAGTVGRLIGRARMPRKSFGRAIRSSVNGVPASTYMQ
ncbi:MAG: hypothetical protein J6S67_26110 [Methanobrevibacter sp.]|nr:hypothetical protein [Methanobrevibacter sp.]